MSQYTTGTVSTTAGSNIVTGHNTEWSSWVSPGDLWMILDDTAIYTIASVDSDTQITLSANYHTTVSSVPYQIIRDKTPRGYPLYYRQDRDVASIYRDAITRIDHDISSTTNDLTDHKDHYQYHQNIQTAMIHLDFDRAKYTPDWIVSYHKTGPTESAETYDRGYRLYRDATGSILGGLYRGANAGRVYIAPYSISAGGWMWDEELQYIDYAPGDNPKWQWDNGVVNRQSLTLPSGITPYSGYVVETAKMPSGLVSLAMMMTNNTGGVITAGTTLATVSVNHRPNGIVNIMIDVGGVIKSGYILTTGEIRCRGNIDAGQWFGSTATYWVGY